MNYKKNRNVKHKLSTNILSDIDEDHLYLVPLDFRELVIKRVERETGIADIAIDEMKNGGPRIKLVFKPPFPVEKKELYSEEC